MTGTDAYLDNFLASLSDHLTCFVKPIANAIDHDPAVLAKGFSELNDKFLSRLWFGPSISTLPRALVSDLALATIAESSGALAFTAAQFMGACRRIQICENKDLTTRIGAEVTAGHVTIGVGTTHLKPGSCVVNARKVEGGFVLEGNVPWVSGHGVFSHVLVAARLGVNGSVIALLGFPKDRGGLYDQIEVSTPFALMAMNSTKTVSITLRSYFVSDDDMVAYVPDSNASPLPSIPPFYSFQLGCARAALHLAKDNLGKYGNHEMAAYLEILHSEVARCAAECQKIFLLTERQEILTRSIKARTWMDSLLMRSIYAVMPLIGGRSIVSGSDIGRLAGEAMVYAISLQSEEIITSKLESLARGGDA